LLGLPSAALRAGQRAVLQLGELVELSLALQVGHLQRSLSISSLMWAEPCTWAFSAFQISSRSRTRARAWRSRPRSDREALLEASSFSFFTASRSIFSWIRRRSSLSMTSGLESISILMRAAASSIRSMALSGRKRSVM
jgi:hypothetical protein